MNGGKKNNNNENSRSTVLLAEFRSCVKVEVAVLGSRP